MRRRLQLKGRNKSDLITLNWIRFHGCGELFLVYLQSDLSLMIRGIAVPTAYSSIPCFRMETRAVLKDFDTTEHAKEGDVTAVFKKEDKEAFNEEGGNKGMSLFGFKLLLLTRMRYKLWKHYNMFLYLDMMILRHISLQLFASNFGKGGL